MPKMIRNKIEVTRYKYSCPKCQHGNIEKKIINYVCPNCSIELLPVVIKIEKYFFECPDCDYITFSNDFMTIFCPECDNKEDNELIGVIVMSKTRVVNIRQEKYDIYIGRPSIWGNPFKIGKDGNRDDVIEKYRKWILNQPKLLKQLKELKNKTLGCFCKPAKCHGDILIELIKNIS